VIPREVAMRRAGRILAAARAERDAMTPEDAARAAYSPGGPPVEEIAALIRQHRAEARAQNAARAA
jgi:hypothetical protein